MMVGSQQKVQQPSYRPSNGTAYEHERPHEEGQPCPDREAISRADGLRDDLSKEQHRSHGDDDGGKRVR